MNLFTDIHVMSRPAETDLGAIKVVNAFQKNKSDVSKNASYLAYIWLLRRDDLI